MGGDMMPKEQYHFIKAIQDHMLEASNMNQHEAWDFGFRVWQFKDYLYWFMTGYGTEKKADTPQMCQDCLTCRYNSDEWDSPKCDSCSKAHSNYEPQTEGSK